MLLLNFMNMILFYWQLQLDASYWYLACSRSRFEESIQRSNICILLLSRSPIAGPLPLWPWKLTQMDPSSIGLEAPTWWDRLTHVYTHTHVHAHTWTPVPSSPWRRAKRFSSSEVFIHYVLHQLSLRQSGLVRTQSWKWNEIKLN